MKSRRHDPYYPGPMAQVTVAFDIGPTLTPLTGVGQAVVGMRDAVMGLPDAPALLPYVLSWRGTPPAGGRRLPLPAALAHRWWARRSWPPVDRWLPGTPQVLHGTNYVVPPARLPRLVSVYDCWFLRHTEHVHPDVARAGAVLRRAVATGAVVHTSSQASADAVHELMGDRVRVHVIPLGAPTPPPAPTSTFRPIPELLNRPFVLALGTLERRKNLPRLIEAFAGVSRAHGDVRLVLAGGAGNDADAIDEAIARLPRDLTDRVLLTGRIDEVTKAWLLHHATVLAYPSLDEGFGFPLLEAMALNLPVVAARAGSIPEVAGDAAVLVNPLDVDSLGAALATVLDDETRRHALIAAGRQRVEAYPWSATGQGLADLYAALAMETSQR
jgi:glycosyltransferase involved in cell wall biosynthesis